MKKFPLDKQPEQVEPITLDQLTREEWLLELERASDQIEYGLMTKYRKYRSSFIRLRRFMFPSKRKRIEQPLLRSVVFPIIKNLQFNGSYYMLQKFARQLLYTTVKNFSLQAQVQETQKLVSKKIKESKLQKALRDVNNYGKNGGI
jgi:hypothetical protein